MSKCHFGIVVPWRDIIKYLQKREGCTHFDTLYIQIYTRTYMFVLFCFLFFGFVGVGVTAYQHPRSFNSESSLKNRGKQKGLLCWKLLLGETVCRKNLVSLKVYFRESSCCKKVSFFRKSLRRGSDFVEVFLVEEQFVEEIWSSWNFF